MRLRYVAISMLLLGVICKAQTTSSVSSQPVTLPSITGAKVEGIVLDLSSHTATVTIRNLSDKPITAFDLVIRRVRTDRQPGVSDAFFRLEDMLVGVIAGKLEGIRSGETFDEVIQGVANNVTADLDLVVFSDASAEFTNHNMLMHVMTGRQAIANADNQTKEIIRNASSKEEAIDKLTRLWEESKETAPLMTPVLETHLYNLKNQHEQSAADERQRMMDYADKNEKDAQFISVQANLHRRAQ
jgi:hypothetical protein